MFFKAALCLLATAATVLSAASDTNELTGYEYVVVGSGAGGGPLAARLAIAGHKTLLIEAGDDQGQNTNYSVPAYSALASEDAALSWNFFVHHYADEARQARDYKTSYETPDGGLYTGLHPPAGSKMKGTLYPRTQTLGGCTAHNALVAIYPHRSDFDHIASLTGDASWSADNMRRYFIRMEDKNYGLPLDARHGYSGWLSTEYTKITLALQDPQLLSLYIGGALASGKLLPSLGDLGSLLLGDANADTKARDKTNSYYFVPLSSKNGARVGSRDFVVAVRDAKNQNGKKKYPLDVRLNCHVTKVILDESGGKPRATGVEFLDGQYLYKASPRYGTAGKGKPGKVLASREVIVAGGTYNSPQILKLSGIGPRAELEALQIPVVVDLPGVGGNLQDHYEINVQGKAPKDFAVLKGCTFGLRGQHDACLDRWEKPLLGDRGTLATNGLPVAMFHKSSAADDGEYDNFIFGGPVNFRGYFPGYSVNITEDHDWFTWAILKAHPRNRAGTVRLRSADPLDTPEITYNYFDTGDADAAKDLQALYEAVGVARQAIKNQLVPIREVLPGKDVTSQADIEQYAKDTAWGHHASCTCPIGADGDKMAVLDSSFRVRGVDGLRVVDASVYPRIPGTFTAVSTYMVGEKAADVILSQIKT
ncbi:Glucose-methanol-choline oxidoreductase [Cordyceps militaris]|uniref:Glucose-methanol-choline oxidoreductase n=1 Tax=Cordyceps militaris TaxID=73501 RepID=A0A2H4S5T9_CORMI|nr:Glucose-methanol-choline oxidoreductase [Cordyceps militaris]